MTKRVASTQTTKNAPRRERHGSHRGPHRVATYAYTPEQRIEAVTILVQAGGLTYEGLALARQRLGTNVSESTFARWLKQYKAEVIAVNPALAPQPVDLPGVVEKTRGEVATLLNDAFLKYARRLNQDDVADKAAARDAAVVMGIVYDKLESLISPYVQYHDQLRELDLACQRAAFDLSSVLDDVIASVQRRALSQPSIDIQSLSDGNE